MEFLTEAASSHLSEYPAAVKLCVRKLAQTWADLGLGKDEQLSALENVVTMSTSVWSSACENADAERQALRDKIDRDFLESSKVRESLGDDETDMELSFCQEEASNPSITLLALHDRVTARLTYWRGRRAEKLTEYENIMAVTLALKKQLGVPFTTSSRPDLSRANLDFLRMEQDKLRMDKGRRLERLATLMDQLQVHCSVVGEDNRQALVEVHHTLRPFWDSRLAPPEPQDPSLDTPLLRLAKGAGGAQQHLPSDDLDLSDVMFDHLQGKIEAMIALKADREAQLRDLREVLESLWVALGADKDPVAAKAREDVAALFVGSNRLHRGNIEACQAEVSRLELQKTQAMKDLVVSKARELEAVCAATLMQAPDVSGLLLDMMPQQGGKATGHISEVLSKLVRMIGEVAAEARKRAPLVAIVSELEEARGELAWANEWEKDEQRYKGRDANRNLQRSIRANKLRERVPALILGLQQAAQEWRLKEGVAFLVHGGDYVEEVLPALARDLEQAAADRLAAAHPRSSASPAPPAFNTHGNKPKAPSHPPQAGKGTAVSVKTHVPPSNSTKPTSAQQVTPQSLAKRHSITGPMPLVSPAHGAISNQAKGGPASARTRGASGLSQSMSFGTGELTAAPARARAAADPQAVTPPPRSAPHASSAGIRGGGGFSSLSRAAAAASPSQDPLKDSLAQIISGSASKDPRASPASASDTLAGTPLAATLSSGCPSLSSTPPLSMSRTPIAVEISNGDDVEMTDALNEITEAIDEMSDVLRTRDTTTPKSGAYKATGKALLSAMVDNVVSAAALAEELAEVKGAVAALANPKGATSFANPPAAVALSPVSSRASRIPRLGVPP